MEARAKEQFGDLESGLDLWSAKDGGDSNAIILPGKRMSKKKGKNQVSAKDVGDSNATILPGKRVSKKKGKNQVREHLRTKNVPELTKSQKRKLHKIEEEKEKALLLSESIETLEKYKIQDAAYALMWSSRNLGQVETVRERRRREVQFSKAGLALPQSDKPFKRKVAVSPSCEIEPDSETAQSTEGLVDVGFQQPVVAEKEVTSKTSFAYSKESVSSNGIGAVDRYAATEPVEEIANRNDETCISEDARDSLPMTFNNYRSESNSPLGQAVESQKGHISMMTNRVDCPPHVVLCPPVVVHVMRPKEVESSRKDLPIVMFEQEIMEAINENSTVIICGETGCGKTTQVPQFLYEAGFGSAQSSVRSGIIGVTQPRVIAVLETAKRVSFELFGRPPGKEVGYQVRHDRRVGNKCAIKFMTDGILFREVQSDFLLRKYSIIILDEAHQRSVHTDILVGMLSRVVQTRQNIYEEQQLKVLSGKRISAGSRIFPLKLVLMSATLRVDDFVSGRRIFPNPPPVIEVPTRQFPVTVHFSKRTELVDYIGQAYKKVLSIHKRLPPGGILVFVTGQIEVERLCRRLRKTSKELFENSSKRNLEKEVSKITAGNAIEDNVMKEVDEACEMPGTSQIDRFSSYEDDPYEDDPGDLDDELDFCEDVETDSDLEGTDDVDFLNHETETIGDLSEVFGDEGRVASLTAAFEVLSGKTTWNPDSDKKQVLSSTPESCSNHSIANEGEKRGGVRPCVGAMHVLPLYSLLRESESRRVFEGTREGERLVIVATNVAETSLTIPGVKYVVDTGKEKVKNYNPSNGIETYEVQWISKASAAQRAGRAGRTAPGHCYRLYSSAVFNDFFPDFSIAAISKVPVDDIVLSLKSMGVCKVSNFPFPTPPEVNALTEAERCLTILEALDSNGSLTPLGKAMAHYPMRPRHSRMLLTVIQIMKKVKSYDRANLVLGYAVAAAASLSYPNPFVFQLEGSHTDMDGLKQDKEKSADKEGELGRKKLKRSAKLARAKFANPHSDVLTIAYALQHFEHSTTQDEFCNDHSLQKKIMTDISKLRNQLLQMLFDQSSNSLQQDFSWTHGTKRDVECAWMDLSEKYPLLPNEEELLCQAICAGLADRIAKRVRGVSASDGDRKVNATRYHACMVKETVFLPRWSSVSKFAPEFLVYSELLHTKRPYMQVVTGVKSDWLVKYAKSHCTFSAPLADPKPYYDPLTDQVFSWVVPSFGPHRWELPLHNVPIVDVGRRVAVFSASLLEGNVLPCLRSVKKFMAATPASILRPEGAVQKRVGNLLNKLNSRLRVIDSCAMLREAWDENPKELYFEILDCFQEGFHYQFEDLWAKMHHEVLLDPKERFPKRFKREKGDITL